MTCKTRASGTGLVELITLRPMFWRRALRELQECLKEFLEARVVAEAITARPSIQDRQYGVSLSIRCFQHLQCVLVITESQIDEGQKDRGDITRIRSTQQIV